MTAAFAADPAEPSPIADYALIGDLRSAALVSRSGAVDWLCWPRFDSPACFAALLGTSAQGRWRIAPAGQADIRRAYRGNSLVLETVFSAPAGAVALTDLMPLGADTGPWLIRLVEGRRGCLPLRCDLALRGDYGAGPAPPDLALRGTRPGEGESFRFQLAPGERRAFLLGPADAPAPADPWAVCAATEAAWEAWAAPLPRTGPYAPALCRSALTLRALVHAPTGAMVAAPTTSLPEAPGGCRNWDYRFCWLRDSALAVSALLRLGLKGEAIAWRDWLLRTVDDPASLQIMYGLSGERDLAERERPDLPGYGGARPVRIGNAAHGQRQLDVWGEIAEALDLARAAGLADPPGLWAWQRGLTERLAALWESPDEGIWEVRGGARHFVHSKVMAWVAIDRALRSAGRAGLEAPLAHWRGLREAIHASVCAHGFSARRNSFVQSYGAEDLDAALLQIPLCGFLPPDDPRVAGTIAAIESELLHDGLVWRYSTADGLPPGEGAFLACSFWLVEARAMQGRAAEARALFERLLALANDVGLLAEEADPKSGLALGNFPQGFSHLALLDAARRLQE